MGLVIIGVVGLLLGLTVFGLSKYNNYRTRKCFLNFPPWSPKPPTDIGDNQLLVETRYGVNIIVDALDKTVSQTIIDDGTW